jgi:hypothetical protein
MIDIGALNEHLYEYNVLSNKPKRTAEDSRRMAYLQTAISALKSGASLAEFVEADRRAISDKYGLNIDRAPGAREIEARGWRDLVAGSSRNLHWSWIFRTDRVLSRGFLCACRA